MVSFLHTSQSSAASLSSARFIPDIVCISSIHLFLLPSPHASIIGYPYGPSIKYVTLFLANFDPPPPVTLCHTSWDPPESTSHISDPLPRFLVGLVQKSRTKVPCTNSISIVRGGFCPGGLSGLFFVRSPFCHNTSVTTES